MENACHRPLRTAVVGTRGQAERVAMPTIQASEHATLVGVLGGDPERTRSVAHGLGVVPYGSLDDLVAGSDVEAVWITAPNHLHAEMAAQLLESGVHVLLEKPMAIDESEAARLVELAASSRASLRVAYQHRFRDAHQDVRNLIRAGDLTDIGSIRVHRYWKFPYFGSQRGSQPSAWRSSPASSGGWSINDIGCHLVDLVLWLSDARPVTVLDCYFTRQYPGVPNDSSTFLTLRLGGACIATIECSNVLESPGSLLELYAAGGWARLTNSFHQVATSLTSFRPERVTSTSDHDTYLRMFDDFIGACRGDPSEGATALESLLNVQVVQRARARGRYLEDFV